MPVGPLSRYRDLEVTPVEHATRGTTRSLPVRRALAPPPAVARRHRVTSFDTLDLLARRYLGREEFYWRLLDANDGGPNGALVPATLLEIPSLESAIRVRRPG